MRSFRGGRIGLAVAALVAALATMAYGGCRPLADSAAAPRGGPFVLLGTNHALRGNASLIDDAAEGDIAPRGRVVPAARGIVPAAAPPAPSVPGGAAFAMPVAAVAAAVAAPAAAVAMPVAAAVAPAPAAPAATYPPPSGPGVTVAIVGRVATTGGVALPGVTVRLAGAPHGTAVTDANGSFAFRVPPGSYALAPARGAATTFAPATVDLPDLITDVIQDFTCSGACVVGPIVVPGKELVIADPSVVGDPRASNAAAGAPWSFRFLVEQMTPAGVDPADFIGAWLGQLEVPDHSVNGFPVDVRKTSALRTLWPTAAGGRLDLSKAPFRLLAITNRVDLHAAGNGEARLVYGVVDASGAGRPMTVIFEFELPSRDATTGATLSRKDWAAKFHALGNLPFGAGYDAALQEITDLFTRRNSSPERPGGSAIAQVRSNEILMGGPWQLREFHLNTAGGPLALWLSTTAQTPADGAATAGTPANQTLVGYINGSRAALHGAFATVPAGIVGGQATENFSWSFAAPVDPAARHAFAGQTCNGCHFSEIGGLQLDGFYHVSPLADPGPDGSGRLSSFVRLFEFARRALFTQVLLTCDAASCPVGAEPAL